MKKRWYLKFTFQLTQFTEAKVMVKTTKKVIATDTLLKVKPVREKRIPFIIQIWTGRAPALINQSHPSLCISQASDQPLLSSVKTAAIYSLIPLFLIHDPIPPVHNSPLSSAQHVASLSYSSFIKRRGMPPLCRRPRGGEEGGREEICWWLKDGGLPLQGGCGLAE